MNFEKLNSWLTVLTNIAVVFGLLLVAYEIRQNEEVIDAEVRQLRSSVAEAGDTGLRELNASIGSDEVIAAIWLNGNNAELSDELERLRYEKLTDIWIGSWETVWMGWEANRLGAGSPILDMVKWK